MGESDLKLILDEMYTGLREYFEIQGWEVVTVHDAGLKGARDKKVIDYAEKNGLLIVTQDPQPADLADLRGVPYILISKKMIAKMADAKIREKYPDVKK
jgi:predicted nuclease of predicted toxin-antitoxin system